MRLPFKSVPAPDGHSVESFVTSWLPAEGRRYLSRFARPALNLSLDDLVQEVAVKVLKWEEPEAIEDPYAFARILARNIVRDARRRASRRVSAGSGEVSSAPDQRKSETEHRARTEEARRVIDISLERFKGRPAQAARAYFETGSYEAAARLLGMEPATVRMNYSRFCGMVRGCVDLKTRSKEVLTFLVGVLAASSAAATEAFAPSKRLKRRLICGTLAFGLLGGSAEALLKFTKQIEQLSKVQGAVGGGASPADVLPPTGDLPVG